MVAKNPQSSVHITCSNTWKTMGQISKNTAGLIQKIDGKDEYYNENVKAIIIIRRSKLEEINEGACFV
jgi:hypothetical protein